MNRVNQFIGLLLLPFVVGCISKTQQKNSLSFQEVEDVEDFEEFHKKFFSDSIFQLSRIVFPLEAADSNLIYGDQKVEDQENDEFFIKNNKLYLKKKGWNYLKASVANNEFSVNFEKKGSIVWETVRSKESEWAITFEFSLVENRWMLTYFANVWV
jgi:hypothetical protein